MTRLTRWRILLSYKLIIEGIDEPILIDECFTTSLAVANKTFFSRLVSALLEGSGEGLEKFAFYHNDDEIKFSKVSLSVVNPFDLPFKNAALLKSLFQRIEEAVRFNDSVLIKVNELQLLLNQTLSDANENLNCEYDFGVEFDVKKYLKTFGYSSDVDSTSSLLESLISFLNFIADVAPEKLLFFVNLGNFLDNNDINDFCKTVFSLKLTAFIVNSGIEVPEICNNKNYAIDQHFLLN